MTPGAEAQEALWCKFKVQLGLIAHENPNVHGVVSFDSQDSKFKKLTPKSRRDLRSRKAFIVWIRRQPASIRTMTPMCAKKYINVENLFAFATDDFELTHVG